MSKKPSILLSASLLLSLGCTVLVAGQAAPPAPSTPHASVAPAVPHAPAPHEATATLAQTPPPSPDAAPHAFAPQTPSADLAPSTPAPGAHVAAAVTPPAPSTPSASVAPAAPPSPPAQAQSADAPDVSYFFLGDNFLGVYTEDVTRENMSRFNLREPRGVAVTRVVKDSPAERAGLRENDVIVRFDGEATTSIRKLNRLIDEAAPQHAARLTILRSGAEQEINVTLGTRQSAPGILRGEVMLPGQLDDLRRRAEELSRQGDLSHGEVERFRLDSPGLFSMSFGMNRRIGVSTTTLTEQLADYFGVERGGGVLVSSVSENSPASRAGLKAGDIITEIDGERVGRVADLARGINRKKDGEVTLTVVRDKKSRSVKLTPESVKSPEMEFNLEAPAVALTLPRITLPQVRMPKITLPRIDIRTPRLINTPLIIRPNRHGSRTVIL